MHGRKVTLLVLQWRCLACACSHTCHNVTCVSAPAKRTCWRMLLADCLHGRAAHAACLPLRPPFRNTSGPLAPSPLRLSALTYTRSLANYTAETGFAPATHDVFIEAPMSAVDRANLDLVLPQIAAMQTFVSALARLLRCRGMIMVMLGFREVRTACGLLRPGTRRARGHACAARCQSRARICRAAAGTQCFECCVRCTWHACCAVRQRRQPAEPA